MVTAGYLQICQGILHGGSPSEGHHNGAVAPANQAARVLLGLPEALRPGQLVQAQGSVHMQSGVCCEGGAFKLLLSALLVLLLS